MANERSEYKEEYCGLTGKRRSKTGSGVGIAKCSKSEDFQPVGGRAGALYRMRQQELELSRSTDAGPVVNPFPALAVPDVHKLRYMHNNYMTADDWY